MDAEYLKHIPTDSILRFIAGKSSSAWKCFGCIYVPELKRHRFLVWAPNALGVSVVGDFNSWDCRANPMERLDCGVWAAFIPGLENGCLYKLSVLQSTGMRVLKADPFAAFGQSGGLNSSAVWTDGEFEWTDGAYMEDRARKDLNSLPVNVYELHAGAWRHKDSGGADYGLLADELPDYLSGMHYTHAELMPINEYPFDGSWGYQVTGYYAPTSRYGNPGDFKRLVNSLHERGKGIILDWVPAHFPKDRHGLAYFDGTPLFECSEKRMAEHPDWGTLIFDYSKPQVRSFLISSACKWFEEYHIDGLRVDAVASMLYLNYSRGPGEYTPNALGGYVNLDAVKFLIELNKTVREKYPGAVMIAEESSAYPYVTRPAEMGGLGFSFKWDMGFMHDTLEYMKLDPVYRKYHHDRLTFSMMYCFSEHFMLAFSHDEVVHGKRSMLNKMYGGYEQRFANLKAFYGYWFAHPGKKLSFMGNEFAHYDEFSENRPLDRQLLEYPAHSNIMRLCRELNRLYCNEPALYENDDSWAGFKWLKVDDRDRSCYAFLRSSRSGRSMIAAVCNFTPVAYPGYRIGLPAEGTLSELFNSDDRRYGGSGMLNTGRINTEKEPCGDFEYTVQLDVPPMSCVYFRYVRKSLSGGSV